MTFLYKKSIDFSTLVPLESFADTSSSIFPCLHILNLFFHLIYYLY